MRLSGLKGVAHVVIPAVSYATLSNADYRAVRGQLSSDNSALFGEIRCVSFGHSLLAVTTDLQPALPIFGIFLGTFWADTVRLA